MFHFRAWLRRSIRPRRAPQLVVQLEPLEERIVPTCTFGANIMAVSTHLVGSYSSAVMPMTQKPTALVADDAGHVYAQALRDALADPHVRNPDLRGVPQGLDAFAAVAERLGVATPQTRANGTINAIGGPVPMGFG